MLELELTRLPPDPEHLLGWDLELPPLEADAPIRSAAHSFELRGWVIGKRMPVKAMTLALDGLTVSLALMKVKRLDLAARYPQGRRGHMRGFHTLVNALRFPVEFELTLAALFDDDSTQPLGLLRGRRHPARSDYPPKLQPLLVTTLGRSGSTALMRLLAAHPAIVAYDPTLNETRVASYWAEVLVTLADPRSYLAQIFPETGLGGLSLWSSERAVPSRPNDIATQEWLDTEGVSALATFCQARIDGFYTRLVETGEPSQAVYFAEKCQPATGNRPTGLLAELYPALRELVLVRDFRDMICSMMSYRVVDGAGPFRPDSSQSNEDFIRSWGDKAGALLSGWRRRSETAHIVRYEDLVLRSHETVEEMLDYLGLEADGGDVEQLVSTLSSAAPGHRTTDSVSASIGRWRRDLDARLQQVAEETFGDVLEAFGYTRKVPAIEGTPGAGVPR